MSQPRVPYHHGDVPAALEKAATELLTTQSSQRLSLREVARRAGVSHNAPYHHYGDRQGLLRAVAARAMRDLLDSTTAARDSAETPVDRLVAIGRAYVNFAIDRPGAFGAIFDTDITDPRNPNPVTAPLVDANVELLTDAVRAYRPNASEEEVLAVGAGMWGMVHGLAALVSMGYLPREVVEPTLGTFSAWGADERTWGMFSGGSTPAGDPEA